MKQLTQPLTIGAIDDVEAVATNIARHHHGWRTLTPTDREDLIAHLIAETWIAATTYDANHCQHLDNGQRAYIITHLRQHTSNWYRDQTRNKHRGQPDTRHVHSNIDNYPTPGSDPADTYTDELANLPDDQTETIRTIAAPLAAGYTQREIAAHLGVCQKTVSNRLAKLRRTITNP